MLLSTAHQCAISTTHRCAPLASLSGVMSPLTKTWLYLFAAWWCPDFAAGYSCGAGSCFGPALGHGTATNSPNPTGGYAIELSHGDDNSGRLELNAHKDEVFNVSIRTTDCAVLPDPRGCEKSFTGFLLLTDQHTSVIEQFPTSSMQQMSCLNSSLDQTRTAHAFSHRDASEKTTSGSVFLRANSAGETIRLRAYVLKSHPQDPMMSGPSLSKWFELNREVLVIRKAQAADQVQAEFPTYEEEILAASPLWNQGSSIRSSASKCYIYVGFLWAMFYCLLYHE